MTHRTSHLGRLSYQLNPCNLFFHLFSWGRECPCDRPTSLDASSNYSAIESKFFAPLRLSKSYAFVGVNDSASLIRVILRASNPMTVRRAIVALVVNPVNLVFRRGTFPHVLKEGSKRVLPFIADFNTSATVVFKALMFRIKASCLYSVPTIILGSFDTAMDKVVLIACNRRSSFLPDKIEEHPFAVFRRKVFRLIFTMKAMFSGRSWPYIGKELLERIFPLGTYFNAFRPMKMIAPISDGIASSFYGFPDTKLWGSRKAMSSAMMFPICSPRSHNLFDRKPSLKPSGHGMAFKSKPFAPLGSGESFVFVSNIMVSRIFNFIFHILAVPSNSVESKERNNFT